ncbi:MAG: hypothetical protein A3I39_01500 [Candidatus Yanofskybacteria bacterium RIFCSPLOWO2_02_FULL_47_9b]|uniref:Uncharacterized protein n=1 Tax=Candidatus Yanofskybacteria bacterium RIFCSPLOWO2_02_FULL_47_9b TaxID=1802708 RepID=A0A1F8HAA2_9BACT|nr:MAG: hypothetical protein A3I39_01500 [Candidatus Yanofskybacteria bacterium RIFCSPLOWO2_02_FULL_47_9b]
MYYYHFNLIDYLILKLIAPVFSWEAISAIATIVIGIFAWRISQKQLALVNFAEVYLQAKKLGDGYNWEFQLRNGSSHALYITEIKSTTEAYKKYEDRIKISRRGEGRRLSLPPKDSVYYTLPVPQDDELGAYKNKDSSNCEIRMDIYFEDNLGKYKSHHVAWFQPPNAYPKNGIWSIQNLDAEKLD